jgi:hypothetical protein
VSLGVEVSVDGLGEGLVEEAGEGEEVREGWDLFGDGGVKMNSESSNEDFDDVSSEIRGNDDIKAETSVLVDEGGERVGVNPFCVSTSSAQIGSSFDPLSESEAGKVSYVSLI